MAVKKRAAQLEEGKRYPLNMRTTKVIRDKVERAAAISGRSLAQEVENRVERSILFDEDTGSASVRSLVDMVRLAAGRVEAKTGKAWHEDHHSWAATKSVVDYIFDNNKPPFPSEIDPAVIDAKARHDQAVRHFDNLKAEAEVLNAKYNNRDDPEANNAKFELYERIFAATDELRVAGEARVRSWDPHVEDEERADAAAQQAADDLLSLFRIRK
jgi:hypothetical protein